MRKDEVPPSEAEIEKIEAEKMGDFPGDLLGPSEAQKDQWLKEAQAAQERKEWAEELGGDTEGFRGDEYGSQEGSGIQGLMDRNDGGENWGSRDFHLPVITCGVMACPCNSGGKCEMPSAIKINNSGQCIMALKSLLGTTLKKIGDLEETENK